jgi:hypothetical protein
MAIYLLNSSKKGMSALQMHRMMGGSYKTAWFMMHRIREAMRESKLGPLGGEGKFVEADETFTGGKAKNRAYKAPPPKEPVLALVNAAERSAASMCLRSQPPPSSRSFVDAIAKDSHFRTDESGVYWKIGEGFASHRTVNHFN